MSSDPSTSRPTTAVGAIVWLFDQLISLLKESVLIQGAMTLGVTGVLCYLVIADRHIPDLFASAWALLLGFYFGSKATFGQRQMAETIVKSLTSPAPIERRQ